MKKGYKILSIVFFILLFVFFINAVKVTSSDKLIHVKKGDTFYQVADTLVKNQVVKSKSFFILLVKLSGQGRNLKTGYYRFKDVHSIFGIIKILTKGQIANKVFTIPEGFNVFQIADILKKKNIIQKKEFLRIVKSPVLLNRFNIKQSTCEGFLYPDTYFIPYDITAGQLVEIMIGNFFNHINALYLHKLKEKYGSIEMGITIASLVEWEAQSDFERPIIAGVFLNRIKKGLNLASCATVLYALNHHKSRLLFKDLQVKSPYNTYLYKGLPPTPICNPSEKSILAAIYPAKVDYLYFVSMKNGRHYFSSSYKKHLKGYKYFILGEKEKVPGF